MVAILIRHSVFSRNLLRVRDRSLVGWQSSVEGWTKRIKESCSPNASYYIPMFWSGLTMVAGENLSQTT